MVKGNRKYVYRYTPQPSSPAETDSGHGKNSTLLKNWELVYNTERR
jgi:hypothetical protein